MGDAALSTLRHSTEGVHVQVHEERNTKKEKRSRDGERGDWKWQKGENDDAR